MKKTRLDVVLTDLKRQIYPLVDYDTLRPLFSYLVQATNPISQGEEVTVDYGKDYFTNGECCLCESCSPRPPQPFVVRDPGEQPDMGASDVAMGSSPGESKEISTPALPRRKKVRRARKRLRDEEDG